jgi:DNA-directed RNA polymerase specialized sigma24 family protein
MNHIQHLRKGADIRNWWGWLKNTAFARSTDILRREGSIKDLERAYSVKIAEERSRSEDLKHSKKIAGYIKFMGDPYKKALHHVYIKGTSQKEAAKDMGITYEYFRVVLQRGRDKLREMIDTLRIQGDRDG